MKRRIKLKTKGEIKMYKKTHCNILKVKYASEDEFLDPYNPRSIWAYMWFQLRS